MKFIFGALKLILAIFLMLEGLAYDNIHSQTLSEQIREGLRTRIEASGVPSRITVGSEVIHASIVLPRFYEQRGFKPAWSGDLRIFSQVDYLIESIGDAHLEGLRPEDYHIEKILSLITEIGENQKKKKPLNSSLLINLDLLCTDAFLIYGSHLLSGRVNPIIIHSEWIANRREADLAIVLKNALEKNQIRESLQSLLPQEGYRRMRFALAFYRNIASRGGYPLVPQGPKMQVGDRGERIIALRNRLIISGDLFPEISKDDMLFDEALENGVRRFQKSCGLDVNGVVDQSTLSELNVPVGERIAQIIVNMERWRWLPQSLGRRYVLVNIANFELDIVEDEQIFMTMRVVVGRPYRRTPVFSDKMSYLVFCPYWNVPKGIATQDILPAVQKDVNYLENKKIRVYQGWAVDAEEIEPKTIDWSSVTADNFPYRFRQDPGLLNALGRVKFMFPNQFGVYLHDTPALELFGKTERAFSSGCIRVEKPIELAEYVLGGDPRWTRAKIYIAIDKGVEQTVPLPELIDIHLLYWTAWADEDGTIHFRKDVYDRDNPLYKAICEEVPSQ